MDASFALARSIASTRFEDLPADAVAAAKTDILDTLGAALASSKLTPDPRKVVALVMEAGGNEESTILGFGGRVPSWMAAFANGAMAHAMEYDDFHEAAAVHAGVAVVPASLAVAERLGNVDGKRLITAVVLGIDLSCRMSLAASGGPKGWHPSTLYGYFGAAAAASSILGLDTEHLQNALGIAYSQAAGNFQALDDDTPSMRLQPAFSSKGGVLSALLAQKGITGATNSLEGEFGLYNVYHKGRYNPSVLTSELGKRFEITNLSFKLYPSVRGTHASIDAALQLVHQHNILPGEVESITVFKNPASATRLSEPLDRMRRPTNVLEAQHNLLFTVATAVVKRKAGLTEFLPEAISDPAVLEMAQKVTVQGSTEFPTFFPAAVEIRMKSGETHSLRVDHPSGSPENPISREDLVQKFMECASRAVKPPHVEYLKKVVEMVMNLEGVKDAGSIVRLLG